MLAMIIISAIHIWRSEFVEVAVGAKLLLMVVDSISHVVVVVFSISVPFVNFRPWHYEPIFYNGNDPISTIVAF
jgi:hypothetical protein